MPILIKAKKLLGYVARSKFGDDLKKSFNLTSLKGGLTEYAAGEGKGGLVSKANSIWEGTKSLIGGLWKGVKAVLWSIGKLVQLTKIAFDYVWTFNWNVSAEEVEAGYQALKVNASGALGRVAGRTLGFVTAAAVSGGAMMTVNKTMAVYALQMAATDQQDEILGELESSTRSVATVAAGVLIKQAYRGLKFWGQDVAVAITKRMEARGWAEPGMAEHISNVYSEKSEPFTFSGKYNEWKETKSPTMQEFLDEFGDEFSDSFWDTLICIGNSVDQFHAEQALVDEAKQTSQTELVSLELSPSPA